MNKIVWAGFVVVALALAGCGSSGDSDAVPVPAAATQGGNSNKNPRMQGAMGPQGGGAESAPTVNMGG